MSGKVYLVGAGPGDPELLTVKALKLLGRASVVLHDALVSAEVLALIGRDAERIDVGKRCGRKLLTQDEINALLISSANSHQVVVRLKGGDPTFFGRAGEEIAALREAGIAFEIVPGITAAAGAAAAVGISLTDRRIASQVLFTSIHRGATNRSIQWGGISSETTVVIYMPGPDYAYVVTQLREAGWPDQTPCAIVSNATSIKQQIRTMKLSQLADEGVLPSPALMIIGHVVTGQAIEAAQEFWINTAPSNGADRDAAI
ncbi:MAG: uroporphyrinogen-III C-methyltransferase [Candidatus Acidiferrales bacterium]